MRKPIRTAIVLAGAVAVVVLGFVVFFALRATDTITFTEKIQSVELPGGHVLGIYRTSTWEHYDCRFEVRDRAGKVVIPRKYFNSTPYWSFKSAAGESTPEARTTFHALIGAKSGVAGLASAEDQEILLALIDPAHLQSVAATPIGLSSADTALGGRLLSELRRDFPDRTFALEATDEAAKLRKQRYGLEGVR